MVSATAMSMSPTCTVAMGTARRTRARTSSALGTKLRSMPEGIPRGAARAKRAKRARGAFAALPAPRHARRSLRALPVGRAIVLQELAPHVAPGVHAADDRVHDARAAIDDVERRVEAMVGHLARRDLGRILVGDPAGVDAVHVD